jgi:hypothetical protein
MEKIYEFLQVFNRLYEKSAINKCYKDICLVVVQLLENFPTFYGTRRFIIVFLSQINPVHATPSHLSEMHLTAYLSLVSKL